MADVLRQVQKDHGHVHTYRGGAQGCRCGQRDPNVIGSSAWIWGHIAQAGEAALSAAGYGPVRDAQKDAWYAGRYHGAKWPFGFKGLASDDNPYRSTE